MLPIERAFIWSRSGAEGLASKMCPELGIDAQAVSDLSRAARASDVIITCTPARSWFLGREHLSRGTFIAAVGATVLTSRKSSRRYSPKAPWFLIFSTKPLT